jgi:hypothetical protein
MAETEKEAYLALIAARDPEIRALLSRACRGTEVGCISQRLQPKEHQVLVLG